MSNRLEISYRPLADLVPYARNSRTHSNAQVEQIAASIREFGFTNPVLIDADGGIIAGHGRVMAAQILSMTEVPCIILIHLTEVQRRAYVIADNNLPLNSGWDEGLLKVELKFLNDSDLGIDVLGFSDEFLTDLFGDGKMKKSFDRGSMDDDGEPELQNPGRYPITMILDEDEFFRWDELKQKKGMSDKRLLFFLMEGK